MSGGATVPKAPDLSGNINTANQTAATATSNAAQTMNTANTFNQNAQQNLSGVTAQTNSMAGQIGSQASNNINTYGSTFVPLQQQQAEQAQNYGSQENVQKLQGMAVANANTADQAARANSASALASEGVDPASIHGAALDRQASVQNAGQVAAAGTQSALNTQNTAIGLTQQANQLGLQVGQAGTAGAATAAQVGQEGQNTINQTNASGVNNLTAANSYLNTGVNANNSGVNANQAQFQDQNQVYQDQQAQNNSTLGGIGTLVGGAAQIAGKAGALSFMGFEKGGVVGGSSLANGARQPLPHSGLPVVAGHVRPHQALPFVSMEGGGQVTAQGALPVGAIPGTTDRKPAMLTPDEFVVPKDVANFKGHAFFHNLIDKSREEMNKRRAIPVQHAPHMTMQ